MSQQLDCKRRELERSTRCNPGDQMDVRIARSRDPDLVGRRHVRRACAERVDVTTFDVDTFGFRISLTYRFGTSLMTITAVRSDDLTVRWYMPLEEGTGVFSIGCLGEGLPQDAETALPRILERYRTVWHPAKRAAYVVNECLDSL